jgi:pimeloyl-ACP methyl ester carboxylesterase
MGAQPTINAENVAAMRHWLIETPLSEEWQKELAKLHGDPYWRSLPGMYVEGQEKLVANGGVIITDEELSSIRCPALIMHGKRDRIVPVDYAQIISERIPGAQLLLFDAGHAAHLRFEKEYTEAILDYFLDQQGRKESQ